ncbi:hypothetical protein ACU4GA_20175 [Methylobacterium oryzae CBMB20]
MAALGFGLGAADRLRGHLFTGFPWNTLGMALAQNLWLMQWAAVIGLYGLCILAVLVCAAPATLATGANPCARFWAERRRRHRAHRHGALRRRAAGSARPGGVRCPAAAGPAQPAPGCQVQAGEPGRHRRPLHRAGVSARRRPVRRSRPTSSGRNPPSRS